MSRLGTRIGVWVTLAGCAYAAGAQAPAAAPAAPVATPTPAVAAPAKPVDTPATAPGEAVKPGSTVTQTEVSPSQAKVSSNTSDSDESLALPQGAGVLVDQVVAVVNGDLILESDVEEDRRFQAFQPYTNPTGGFDRDQTVRRLIDRALILQQAKLQPDSAVTDDEVAKQIAVLRKEIPACKQFGCETDAGWAKFVQSKGFTVADLNVRWKQRMQVLRFIEVRFRSGVDITKAQVQEYYDKQLLPEYAKRGVTAPKLETISDRIQEILLQEQVSSLLADWLKSLKAQGTVRVMTPGEGGQ